MLHISGGPEPESTEEACCQKAENVAAGHITAEEVSKT